MVSVSGFQRGDGLTDSGRGRILTGLLLVLLVFLQYRLWFEPQGVVRMFRLKRELTKAEALNESLRQRNAGLREEVSQLQQGGDAMESRAREDLGMIRKGETFYHENTA